jgi:hypothetical protein
MPTATQDVLNELGIEPDRRRPAPVEVHFDSLDANLPGWGLIYSFTIHALLCLVLFLLSFAYRSISLPRLVPVAYDLDLSSPNQVIYLPTLGGGSAGTAGTGPHAATRAKSPGSPARVSKGFSYPGEQPILSNPPLRTNPVQTILRPALEKPRELREFVPLPNLVQMAVRPALPSNLITPHSEVPEFHPAAAPPIEQPKLNLPQTPPADALPALGSVAPPPPAPPKPKPEELTHLEMAALANAKTGVEDLVVLSATPAPPELAGRLPLGQTRGHFADFPQAVLRPQDTNAGSRSEGTPSSTAIGNRTDGKGTDAAVSPGAGSNGTLAAGTMGGGSNEGVGMGRAGSGNGGVGHGASGNGAGDGAGSRGGSGSGVGAGPGRGIFPGITIQGGSLNPGRTAIASVGGAALPPQTSYSLTIVSTGTSGGGLGDFGVFNDEKVYTVYLDMRRTAQDPMPAWTLQYALLNSPDPQNTAAAKRAQVAPPFLVVKHLPKLPPELVSKYLKSQIVVYGVLDEDGKLGSVSIKQSPDSRFAAPLLEVLQKWVFRPAEVNGHPVPIKVLLGIPLAPVGG